MYKLRDWIPESNLDWNNLSANPNAIHMLEANPDKINWFRACQNTSIHRFKKVLDVDWFSLSANPNAMHLLNDKMEWSALSQNPEAIHILEKNLDKVDWYNLSINPKALHILE